MNRNHLLVLSGVTAVAVASGVAVAMMQSTPNRPDSFVDVSSPSPAIAMSPSPSSSPAATPTASSPSPSETPALTPTPAPTEKPSRQVESCVVKMALVDDPESPLNVRSGPTTEASVVGQVNNGTYLSVAKEQDGWFQITDPVAGWVAQSRTQYGCGHKVERVYFGTGNTSTEISDRFIGAGFHKYVFNARAGQTMTVTHQSGPFPVILAPDGQPMAAPNEDRDRWSATLPTTGDYTLQLDSNYKGYTYSFLVDIK